MSRALRALARFGAVAATLFALFVTHLPAPSAVGVSEEDPRREDVRLVWHTLGEIAKRLPDLPAFFDPIRSDKTIHFALFLPPAALWALSFGRRLGPKQAAALFVGLAAWGSLDELVQHLGGRDGQWGDVAANLAGSFTGVLVVYAALSVRRATPPRPATPPGSAPEAGDPAESAGRPRTGAGN